MVCPAVSFTRWTEATNTDHIAIGMVSDIAAIATVIEMAFPIATTDVLTTRAVTNRGEPGAARRLLIGEARLYTAFGIEYRGDLRQLAL